MKQILVWSVAWALAIWLAGQITGNLTHPNIALPLLILIALGIWGYRQPRD